ncbi:head decoration protein [Methylorubrum sp. POS3]|uniref:head decoration protein n=1 Tax=Methylorubrum sp. POS3 TaxID=2998492 RepID=UPI00372B4949
MPLLETAPVASDWLKSEAENYRSRDTAIVAAGAGKLKSGHVLGRLTASGKFVPATAASSDGAQTAVAILVFPVDASSADQRAVIVAREATASHNGLVWGPTITDAAKRAAAISQLRAAGILVREGA